MIKVILVLTILVAQVFAEPRVYLEPKQRSSVEYLFKQTLNTELRQLKSKQEKEYSELKKSNKSKREEFDKSEKAARKQFFIEHTHGPDRRAYMKALIERRKTFYAELKKSEKETLQAQLTAKKELEKNQKNRLSEFKKELSEGYKPSESLWKP